MRSSVLRDRPALREVDRRFVYIDPRPDRIGGIRRSDARAPGFFSVIFGSLSSIPREQPIRDNLEDLERQSNEMATLRAVVRAVQPEVEETVERLFGRTLFLDRPTSNRLAAWRAKAQDAACVQAGFAYHGYAHVKLAGIVGSLARLIHGASPDIEFASHEPVARQAPCPSGDGRPRSPRRAARQRHARGGRLLPRPRPAFPRCAACACWQGD